MCKIISILCFCLSTSVWATLKEGPFYLSDYEQPERIASSAWHQWLQTYSTTETRFLRNFPITRILENKHLEALKVLPALKRFPLKVAVKLFSTHCYDIFFRHHLRNRTGIIPELALEKSTGRWSPTLYETKLNLFGITTSDFVRNFNFAQLKILMNRFPHLQLQKVYGLFPADVTRMLFQRELLYAVTSQANMVKNLKAYKEKQVDLGREHMKVFFESHNQLLPDNLEKLNALVFLEWYSLRISPLESSSIIAKKLVRWVVRTTSLEQAPALLSLRLISTRCAIKYYRQKSLVHKDAHDDVTQSIRVLEDWEKALNKRLLT